MIIPKNAIIIGMMKNAIEKRTSVTKLYSLPNIFEMIKTTMLQVIAIGNPW